MAAAVGPLSYCAHRPLSGPPRGPLPRLHHLELPPRASPALSPIPRFAERFLAYPNKQTASTRKHLGSRRWGTARWTMSLQGLIKRLRLDPNGMRGGGPPPPHHWKQLRLRQVVGGRASQQTEVTSRAVTALAEGVPRLG